MVICNSFASYCIITFIYRFLHQELVIKSYVLQLGLREKLLVNTMFLTVESDPTTIVRVQTDPLQLGFDVFLVKISIV